MSNKIPKIELSDDEQERLKLALDRMITEADDFRSGCEWDTLHEQDWKQYLSTPKFKVRTTPWNNSSNIFIPMTETAVNATLANEFDAMLANDPIVKVIPTMPWNAPDIKQFEDDSKSLSDYWDWFYREVINLRQLGADWMLDNTVDGTSAVKARVNRDTVIRREQRQIERILEDQLDRKEIITVEDAFIERLDEISNDVSDMSALYFAPGSYVSPNAPYQFAYPYTPWYFQKQELDIFALNERRRAGYDIPEDVAGMLVETQLSRRDEAIRESEGTANTVLKTLITDEFYMRWPLPARYQKLYDGKDEEYKQKEGDEQGFNEEIIVTYAPGPRHLMRIVPLHRVYPDGKRPHVPMYFQKFPRHIYGRGLARQLRHLQAGSNSIFNQSIDFGSVSVAPWGFYNPGTMGIMPDMIGINPGSLIPTSDPRGVNFPRSQFDPTAHSIWGNIVQTWAEKVSKVSEYQMGRSPSTPNAPRTARGTMAIMQKGQLAFSVLVAQHAESFIEMCRRNMELKRQYARTDTPFRKMNKEQGRWENHIINRRAFKIEADFQFVLNPNRYEEHSLNQALFGIFMQALQAAVQAPPMVADSIRSVTAEVYESAGKKNFNRLWPQDMIKLIQPPPAPPGPPQGMPTGGPPPGPQGMTPRPPGPPPGMPGPSGPGMPMAPPPMMPLPMSPPATSGPEPEIKPVLPDEENVNL